jgi:hypothetical protein
MVRKLKSSVVIKDVNADVCFALDLANDNDQFSKFEGVSCRFLKLIDIQTDEELIFDTIMKEFEGCTPEQVKADFNDFVSRIQKLNLLA